MWPPHQGAASATGVPSMAQCPDGAQRCMASSFAVLQNEPNRQHDQLLRLLFTDAVHHGGCDCMSTACTMQAYSMQASAFAARAGPQLREHDVLRCWVTAHLHGDNCNWCGQQIAHWRAHFAGGQAVHSQGQTAPAGGDGHAADESGTDAQDAQHAP